MTDRSKLLALAERIEALTGPDREVDDAIIDAFGWRNEFGVPIPPGYIGLPMYTGSIDAAAKMVPTNSLWNVGTDIDGPYARVMPPVGNGWTNSKERYVLAATMPLALLSSALRAQAEALS